MRPDALWHGDVCHGTTLVVDDRRTPVRVHALMDDHSRFVVALRVVSTEREQDMLDLFVGALRAHGKSDALYLDNGSTYRGDTLRLLCGRLGISLLHARPYDPEARGKMERFWLTMRRQVLDFCGGLTSLHDVQVRLLTWLDTHYHRAPHAGLMGKTPLGVYAPEGRDVDVVDEEILKKALIVTETRKVRRDTTISIEGQTYELDRGWLAGRTIDVSWSALEERPTPWAEYEGNRSWKIRLVFRRDRGPTLGAMRSETKRSPCERFSTATSEGLAAQRIRAAVVERKLPYVFGLKRDAAGDWANLARKARSQVAAYELEAESARADSGGGAAPVSSPTEEATFPRLAASRLPVLLVGGIVKRELLAQVRERYGFSAGWTPAQGGNSRVIDAFIERIRGGRVGAVVVLEGLFGHRHVLPIVAALKAGRVPFAYGGRAGTENLRRAFADIERTLASAEPTAAPALAG